MYNYFLNISILYKKQHINTKLLQTYARLKAHIENSRKHYDTQEIGDMVQQDCKKVA